MSWVPLTRVRQDFSEHAATLVNLIGQSQKRALVVAKKNTRILRRLLNWIRSVGTVALQEFPALIIDDECDQASVNTATGDRARTAINRRIVDIVAALPKCAYVGYTATPFANFFIDPNPGDLYPRDFIIALDHKAQYFGPEALFGRERLTADQSDDDLDGLDMIRPIPKEEATALRCSRRDEVGTFRPTITPSLQTALHYYWLATAARTARGQNDHHSTMLIHTTFYTQIHERFVAPLEKEKATFRERLLAGEHRLAWELAALWDRECEKVPASLFDLKPVPFGDLWPHLVQAVEATEFVIENSLSQNRVDYELPARRYVVVGGNVLARGLTLEGLVVSFFLRTANAYDTLLQMGRWFGYRVGYQDLPRIWMTDELKGYFFLLATVEQEIRQDIERYALDGLSPLEAGVRVRTHPILEITSRLKMQNAVTAEMSFGGRYVQTVLFHHLDAAWLGDNLGAARALLRAGTSEGGRLEEGESRTILRDVPVRLILEFLVSYHFHERNCDVRGDLLRKYIEAQNSLAEPSLLLWNVVVFGRRNRDLGTIPLGLPHEVVLINRSRFLARSFEADSADIKELISKEDLVGDFRRAVEAVSTKGRAELLKLRGDASRGGKPMLGLYPISRKSVPERASGTGVRGPLEAVDDVLGVLAVFPGIRTDTPQRYVTVDLSAIEREEPEVPELEEEDGNDIQP